MERSLENINTSHPAKHLSLPTKLSLIFLPLSIKIIFWISVVIVFGRYNLE